MSISMEFTQKLNKLTAEYQEAVMQLTNEYQDKLVPVVERGSAMIEPLDTDINIKIEPIDTDEESEPWTIESVIQARNSDSEPDSDPEFEQALCLTIGEGIQEAIDQVICTPINRGPISPHDTPAIPVKKARKCGLCKNTGHNKRNCPNKN